MAKRLKLKLSRVIHSVQLCRFDNPSSFPENPVPASHRLSPINPKALDIGYSSFPAPPPSTPDSAFFKRNKTSKSNRCRSSRSLAHYLYSDCSVESIPTPPWMKEPSFRVANARSNGSTKPRRKIYDASFSDDKSNSFVVTELKNKQGGKNRNNTKGTKAAVVTSPGDTGCFSSSDDGDKHDETETLLSSRSFSYDSSVEISHSLDEITEVSDKEINKTNTTIKVKRVRHNVSKKWKGGSVSGTKTMVLSPRMLPGPADGSQAKESIAVVKKSVNPYDDFKRSMLEMILDRQMFEANDLEQLLQCLLSLNSRQYHGIIIEAFSEIWEILFCDSPAMPASVGL